MQVVKCETRVRTVIGEIEAIVTGICIRDNNVTYELSYFNQGLPVTAWLRRCEFTTINSVKKKAGFVNYDVEEVEDCTQLLLT